MSSSSSAAAAFFHDMMTIKDLLQKRVAELEQELKVMTKDRNGARKEIEEIWKKKIEEQDKKIDSIVKSIQCLPTANGVLNIR